MTDREVYSQAEKELREEEAPKAKAPASEYAIKKFRIIGSSANLSFRQRVEKYGHATILGQAVKSASQLNDICQVYRNPIYETQRIIMLNDKNVVVGVTAISSHRPMETESFPMKKVPSNPTADRREVDQALESIRQAMVRTGATKYYLQHNHPSGRIVPSGTDPNAVGGDIPLTKYYDKHLPGLMGHLIIDHKKFTVIDPHGEFTQHTLEGAEQPDPLKKVFKVHPALGERIAGPMDVFHIVRDYQLNKDGYYVLLVRRPEEGVSGLMEVPKEYFKDRTTAEKAIWKFALLGGGEPFVWGADMGNKVMETLVHYGVVRDVVTPNGESYVNWGHSQIKYSPPKKVFVKEEELAQKVHGRRVQ
jgi:DNA repair protein RadC